MRNPTFLSSHPTGLPAGLTPVIVDQSPELTSRTVFDGHSYQDELDLRSELMPKSAASMSNYGVPDMPLRARDPGNEFGGLQYNHQHNFGSNALSTATFDSSRSQSQGTYHDGLSSRPSTSDDGEYPPLLPGYQVKIVEWSPQEGPAGTRIQATLLSPLLRIDSLRAMTACIGRLQVGATCTPLVRDSMPPYRYSVSLQAPVQLQTQAQTQWSKCKSSVSVSLYVPFEGLDQEVNIDLGNFTYSESAISSISRPDSGLGRKRRTSSTGFDPRSPISSTSTTATTAHDLDLSGARPSKSRYGQLPPIRAGAPSAGGVYAASSQSNSTVGDDYPPQQAEGVQHFYPPLLSGYAYPAACAPPTSSWTGTTSPTGLTFTGHSNTIPLTNDSVTSRGHNPRFVRKRNDQIASISASGAKPASATFNPYGFYPNNKAVLHLEGNLSDMTDGWTEREKHDKRRLVHFSRVQNGSVIHASFRPVDPDQKEPNLVPISCIWRADRKECYVTSVDTISLLEALVTPETAFTVEEKNRIRRNLEGFHPETISKQKPQNEEFFKQIMGYPPPRPRHIEKDVKVFKWSTLEVALKKIISKYCASYASTTDVPRRSAVDGSYADAAPSLQSQDLSAVSRSAQYAMVPSQGHSQHIPLSTTSSAFGDYASAYQQYSSPVTARYPQYATQSHFCGAPGIPDGSSAQVLMQQQQQQQQRQQQQQQQQQQHHHQHHQGRQTVGFGSEWTGSYV